MTKLMFFMLLVIYSIATSLEKPFQKQQSFSQLLNNNLKFSTSHITEIKILSKGQSPTTLILTCSDSRVSTDLITEANLGDLFIHRNIANVFNDNDDSIKSVLYFATRELNITKIVVIGHTGCAGVKHALEMNAGKHKDQPLLKPLNKYVGSIVDLIADKKDKTITNARIDALSMENVKSNVANIHNSPYIKVGVKVEGYIYHLTNGTLNKVI